MAAYCTLRDVSTITGLPYDAESQPSNTEALTIIKMVGAEIDGHLKAAGYTLPITNEDDVLLLKYYNQQGAACQCWNADVISLSSAFHENETKFEWNLSDIG